MTKENQAHTHRNFLCHTSIYCLSTHTKGGDNSINLTSDQLILHRFKLVHIKFFIFHYKQKYENMHNKILYANMLNYMYSKIPIYSKQHSTTFQ